MFNNLIESKAKRQRTVGGMMFSVVAHAVVIGGAVYATLQAGQELEKPKAEKVEFVKMKKKEPPPPPRRRRRRRQTQSSAAAAEGLPGAHGARQHSRRAPRRST